eukprot:gnl/Hemi2/13953_TR4742_c0_g1_i1.p1 gnl/Hemi2/13953_TR4742_c0_g1~~gnl/Hemi2/13953_TR4742_c0_g1_i1.p1  ORF type:complete len:189 (+),score=54.98 gnl/Hemi2/13953_TR4742_c0_g1_i1:138-704(+)
MADTLSPEEAAQRAARETLDDIEKLLQFDKEEHEAAQKTERALEALLEDPILSDLRKLNHRPDLATVERFIALEKGTAISVTVVRLDGVRFQLILPHKATVGDLKKQLQHRIEMYAERKINWRHVWRNHCLVWQSDRLLLNHKRLMELGVRDKDELRFQQIIYRGKRGIFRKKTAQQCPPQFAMPDQR